MKLSLFWWFWTCLVLLFGMIMICCADTIDVEKLANAIFKAENSKSHPYGIMVKYNETSPRDACKNTINHALKDWNGKGDFIDFLADRYCPPSLDLVGNRNWKRNVKYFYRKEKQR